MTSTQETMMTKKRRPVPTNEAELEKDLMGRIEDAVRARTAQAVKDGSGFTAWDIAQLVEKDLPEDYPYPPREARIMAIHRCAATYLTDLLKDMPGAIEWVSFNDFQPTPECPPWCTFHRPDCEGCHFGAIVVNEIEIEIQLEPDWDEPRVDVSGIDWVNGGDLTDLAEALHVAERILTDGEQVPA